MNITHEHVIVNVQMSNRRKLLFPFTEAAGQLHKRKMEGRSVFHTKLASYEHKEACQQAVHDYLTLMQQFCGAGTHTAQNFANLLKDTAFGDIAGQFRQVCEEVEQAVVDEAGMVGTEVDQLWEKVGQSGQDQDNNNVGQDIQVRNTKMTFHTITSLLLW